MPGPFAASLEEPMRRHLTMPCDIIVSDETGIISRLADIDVLVTMALTAEMGRAATRLRLVQVPGAGLDRIDRSALPKGTWLANVYGHETGIAEYVIGAMLALTREFSRLDAALRQGDWQSQWAVGDCAAAGMARTRRARRSAFSAMGGSVKRVARRARAFDMNVCAIRRNVGVPPRTMWPCSAVRTSMRRGIAAVRLRGDLDAGDAGDDRIRSIGGGSV